MQTASLIRLLHNLAAENVVRLIDDKETAPHGLGGFEVLDIAAFQR